MQQENGNGHGAMAARSVQARTRKEHVRADSGAAAGYNTAGRRAGGIRRMARARAGGGARAAPGCETVCCSRSAAAAVAAAPPACATATHAELGSLPMLSKAEAARRTAACAGLHGCTDRIFVVDRDRHRHAQTPTCSIEHWV